MQSVHQRLGRRKRRNMIAFSIVMATFFSFGMVCGAQEVRGPEAYPAAYFTPFSPQTALDMVKHLPGFSFDPGDEGLRGFSEAGGNVLIDGERPATKSGGLAAALSAIPAEQVARITIIRGGVSANDVSGQSAVANIIRIRNLQNLSGSLRLAGMADGRFGSAVATASRTLAGFHLVSTTMFEATGERSHGARGSFDTLGAPVRQDDLSYRTDYPEWSERLTLDGAVAQGQMTANIMVAQARLSEAFLFRNDDQTDRFPKHTGRRRGEVSTDWTRGLGRDYSLKLLALANIVDLDADSLSQRGASTATLQTTDRFENRSVSREGILRAAVTKGGGSAWRPEGGVELTWNTLDSRSLMTGADPDHVFVSEGRAEVFGALNWQVSRRWMLAAGAAYEMSRIKSEDGTDTSNRFAFLKPHLTVSYTPDPDSSLRLSLRRSVGQLSFGDFAASANLAQGTASSGNADLGPDSKTTLSLDYDRRFGTRGAFNLSAFYDWRENGLEASVLPSGKTGVVNVKSARVWSLAANLELPLDACVEGGLLRLRYVYLDSAIVDPITGTRRDITGLRPTEFTASFRQDITAAKLSWGIDYARGFQARLWYADEVRLQDHSAEWSLFLETGRFLRSKLRMEVNGLAGIRNTYYRGLYAPNRAAAWNGSEIWDIRTPPTLAISLSRSF
jgi:hypothetical protein